MSLSPQRLFGIWLWRHGACLYNIEKWNIFTTARGRMCLPPPGNPQALVVERQLLPPHAARGLPSSGPPCWRLSWSPAAACGSSSSSTLSLVDGPRRRPRASLLLELVLEPSLALGRAISCIRWGSGCDDPPFSAQAAGAVAAAAIPRGAGRAQRPRSTPAPHGYEATKVQRRSIL